LAFLKGGLFDPFFCPSKITFCQSLCVFSSLVFGLEVLLLCLAQAQVEIQKELFEFTTSCFKTLKFNLGLSPLQPSSCLGPNRNIYLQNPFHTLGQVSHQFQ